LYDSRTDPEVWFELAPSRLSSSYTNIYEIDPSRMGAPDTEVRLKDLLAGE
jgi:hypothetical protein